MSKTPEQKPHADKAIPGGVSNELAPDRGDPEAVRRRDDLTIRGADPKEVLRQEPGTTKDQPRRP